MEPHFQFLTSVASGMTTQMFQLLTQEKDGNDDSISVDETAAIGILKSYEKLFPELSIGSPSALGKDFETLRHAGISTEEAHEIVQLIYTPRTYFIQKNLLNEEFVNRLDAETIDIIVDNSLKKFLPSNGVSTDDLEYDVGGIEGQESIMDQL